MALPATDNFNRGAGAIGANWTGTNNNWQTTAGNTAAPTTFNYSATYWSADAFGNDQYAQTTMITLSDGGPGVRMSAGPRSYHFDVKTGAGNSKIQKDITGTFTDLRTGLTVVTNDVCRIEVSGTTLKAKVNGVQVGTDATDAALSSGSAGLWSYDTSTAVDEFLADTLGGGGGGGDLVAFVGEPQIGGSPLT